MLKENETEKAVDTRTVTVAGRCVTAGARSRKLLERLLGLDEPHCPYRVKAVAWIEHALEASVAVGSEEVVFRIERAAEDSFGLVVTERLVLYFRGQDLPPELLGLVEREAPARLAGLSIEALAEEISRDPELGDPALPMPPGVDEAERPRSLLDTWGNENAYADFFALGELARSQLDSLDPGAFFSFVQHSDCECLHVNPHTGGPVVWLVNYPWDDRVRRRAAGAARAYSLTALADGMITSDIDENDIIFGNPRKLEGLLEQAERIHRRSGKTIFFSNTCTPVVVGEDVESRIKRFKATTGCPLLYLTVTPRSMVNVFHEILVERRLLAEKEAPAPQPRCINLIGIKNDHQVRELKRLLALVGVEVNCVMLPDLTFDLVERLPRASLNVFLPNQLWQHLYDQLQFSSRIPSLSPRAPYGIAATLAWVEEIGSHFGMEKAHRRALRARAKEIQAQAKPLRMTASRHGLGFIVRHQEAYLLTDPAATAGVPLLPMTEEMGFKLEIFIQVEDRSSARRAAQSIHASLAHPKRHVLKAFDSFPMMLRRVSDARAGAFFSSHFFDWRLTSCGKNLFSLQHIEAGLEGALRTARRLLGIVQTPYYRLFGRHLRRTLEGLRQEGCSR